jgi:NitT/TauT family transport system ATP-binding protein
VIGEAAPAGALGGSIARAGEPLLHARGVGKSYANGVMALAGVDFSISRGEFVSLLGPSGCGKSTILRLVAGLSEPSEGTIVWEGGGGRPEIGFVFQDATLTPWSDVFTNVWLPLRLRGVRRRDAAEAIEAALARVGLDRFARALPRELSGGMKMRVSIARALVSKPALLLMDEPFAALDEITRERLNDDLLEIQSTLGATILFVTHSVVESVYLSSRIVVLAARPGRVVDAFEGIGGPRGEGFRSSDVYARRCAEVSRSLRRAMGPEDAL